MTLRNGGNRIVRVDSDGTPQETFVTLDNGTLLKDVAAIRIDMQHDTVPQIELVIMKDCAMHVLGELKVVTFVCFCCGEELEHTCD